MRSIVFFASGFIMFLYSFLNAEEITITKFLSTVTDDPSVNMQQKKHSFLEKTFPGVALIDDIEFKVKEKSFNINDIEYSIRVQPRGFGETKAANRYYRSMLKKSAHKDFLLKDTALKSRYILAIDFLEQQEMHSLYTDLITLYNDKIKVLQKMSISNADFEFGDLIKAENDNTKAQAEDMEFQKLMELYALKISSYLKDVNFTGFDLNELISADTLVNLIEKSTFQFDTNNVYLNHLRLDLDIEKARYDLEKAEARKYISYVGFAVDNGEMLDQIDRRTDGKDYNLNSAYSIEFGIKFPYLTTPRHDIVKRKVDFLKATEEYDNLKTELNDLMNEDLKDLKYYIIQYRYLKAREQEVNAESSLKKYLQLSGIDPLILLTIKESIIRNQINRANTVYGLYRNYIQVIDITGELSKWPLKNFLLR